MYSNPLIRTWLKHLWQRPQPRVFKATGFAHLDLGIFSCSSRQILSSCSGSDGGRRWTAIIRPAQKFAIRFTSGFWPGHSKIHRGTLSQSRIVSGVSLGSLSRWKANLWPSLGAPDPVFIKGIPLLLPCSAVPQP